jgi:hypothetical protein
MNSMFDELPRISGRPSTSSDRAKTIIDEFRTAGRSNGNVTVSSARAGVAPAVWAARSRAVSCEVSAARTNRNTTGAATPVASIAMPGTEYRSHHTGSGVCSSISRVT